MQRNFTTMRHQAQDAFQETAFAAAIRAHQGMNPARRHLPIQLLENMRASQLQGNLLQLHPRATGLMR